MQSLRHYINPKENNGINFVMARRYHAHGSSIASCYNLQCEKGYLLFCRALVKLIQKVYICMMGFSHIYIYKRIGKQKKKKKKRKGKRGEKIKYVWLIRTDNMTYYVFHRLTLTRKFTELIHLTFRKIIDDSIFHFPLFSISF